MGETRDGDYDAKLFRRDQTSLDRGGRRSGGGVGFQGEFSEFDGGSAIAGVGFDACSRGLCRFLTVCSEAGTYLLGSFQTVESTKGSRGKLIAYVESWHLG